MLMPPREPLLFKPIVHDKPWGGDGLWRHLRKGLAEHERAGESWELSDRSEAATVVTNGRFAGVSLRELMQVCGSEILGDIPLSPFDSETARRFPLLVKFIYAREPLSVQVHPGENSPLGEAKTECWYILHAPPGAELIVGVKQDMPRQKMAAKLASADCQEVLRREPVASGDLLFIPAGTVHAITQGLLLYELQQNSDTTFRLYDWGRKDAQGKPRDLHLAQATEVMDLRVHDKHKIIPLPLQSEGHSEDMRVACPYFFLSHWREFAKPAALRQPDRFRIVSVIRGAFGVEWPGGILEAPLGSTLLLPAGLPEALLTPLTAGAEILVSGVPDLEKEIRAPLRRAGYGDEAIAGLAGLDGF